MNQPHYFPDWRTVIVYSPGAPQPQVLHQDETTKVIVVGLEPGGEIPVHPGHAGVYHFLEGAAAMTVAGEVVDVQAGATMVVPAGVPRGMKATTRLAFIAVAQP